MFLEHCQKHGEKLQVWLKKLQVAIAEKDIDKINVLVDNLPILETKEELDTAINLLSEAKNLLEELKVTTSTAMTQMQKNIKFLKVTESKHKSKIDIKY